MKDFQFGTAKVKFPFDLMTCMDELAVLKKLQEVEAQLTEAQKEIQELNERVEALEELVAEDEESDTISFPEDFYQVGQHFYSERTSDDQIQDMVDDLLATELEVGEFAKISTGNAIVMKLQQEDRAMYLVAKDYHELTVFEE